MLETIITSLVLMSVSGLTFIAYKHSKSFSKLFPYLILINFVVWFLLQLWTNGISYAEVNLREYIQSDKLELAKKANDNLKIDFVTSSLISGAISIYLIILLYLGSIIKSGKEDKPEKNI